MGNQARKVASPRETGRLEADVLRLRNPGIEPSHDKLHDECLSRELIGSLAETRIIIEQWRIDYNELRPHCLLIYHPQRACPSSLMLGTERAKPDQSSA